MTILEKANAILAEKEAKVLPENIKSGVTIFDVEGTLVGLAEGSADANATATDLPEGKSAYVNGEKIEGTIVEFTSENGNIAGNETQSAVVQTPIISEVVTTEEGSIFVKIDYVRDTIQRANSTLGVDASTLVGVIGLTADKIKAGETILGITGTYTGETDEGGDDETTGGDEL